MILPRTGSQLPKIAIDFTPIVPIAFSKNWVYTPAVQLLSDTSRGIILALIGIFLVSIQDVFIKLIAGTDVPVHQLLFIRYVIAIAFFGWLIALVSDLSSLKTKYPGRHLIRGLLSLASSISYYLAIAVLPLSEAVAVFFSAPLFVTLIAAFFLKDSVGIHRWTATGVGFVGVLIAVQPGSAMFNPMILLVLFAAVCYAISLILARTMGSTESAVTMSFYTMVINMIGAGIVGVATAAGALRSIADVPEYAFLTGGWVMPDSWALFLIMAISAITVISFYLITQAYRIAPPSSLALFEYSTMIWAVLWGILFFDQFPEQRVLVGVGIIMAAGLYIMMRETITSGGHNKWFTGRALSRFR